MNEKNKKKCLSNFSNFYKYVCYQCDDNLRFVFISFISNYSILFVWFEILF